MTLSLPTSQPLRDAALATFDDRVRVPTYDRTSLVPGVVHLGVGGFHRAHQAVYLDELAERGLGSWGIVGVAMRRRDVQDALAAQDHLFTVVQRGDGDDEARVVGSIIDMLSAPDEPKAVLRALVDPRARIVSLTVTDDGYHVDGATGRLADDDDIRADLARPHRPRSPIGFIVEALDRRRRAGTAPFTVLSCDNVPANGATARAAVVGLAARRDPALAAWIEREVAFPSSMVDRITPATTPEARALVADGFGISDLSPVVTEPFTQWVIEDRFCNDRPALEEVGVEFVADVEPYQRMKRRLLNGSQAALGYVGWLLGHRESAGAMTDELVHRYLDLLMREEIAPTVGAVPGIDPDAYRAALLERFANPKVGDTLARLCRRGSAKVPAHLLPSIAEARRDGRPHELLTLALAAWLRYLRGVDLDGRPIAIADARLAELQPLAVAGGTDAAPVMCGSRLFGWLAEDPMLVHSVGRALRAFERDGLRATVAAYVDAQAGSPVA